MSASTASSRSSPRVVTIRPTRADRIGSTGRPDSPAPMRAPLGNLSCACGTGVACRFDGSGRGMDTVGPFVADEVPPEPPYAWSVRNRTYVQTATRLSRSSRRLLRAARRARSRRRHPLPQPQPRRSRVDHMNNPTVHRVLAPVMYHNSLSMRCRKHRRLTDRFL